MRRQSCYAVRGHLRLVVGGETVGILEYTIIVQLRVGENERYRILRPNQKWIDEHERLTTSDKLDPRERPDRDPSGDPRIRARREQQTLKLEQVAAGRKFHPDAIPGALRLVVLLQGLPQTADGYANRRVDARIILNPAVGITLDAAKCL